MPGSSSFPVDERRFDRALALAALYVRWLRFRVSGLEHVPSSGAALLVGNHAGLRLHDAGATLVAVRRHHPAQRIVRALAHRGITGSPRAAAFQLDWMGGVIGTQESARGLLDEGWLVLTYPEGARSTGRPFRERDTVLPAQQWGRGWARLALDTGVPVIPVGVSGVEASIPTIANSRRLGRRFGLKDDLYPVSPQSPLNGFQPFLTPMLPFPVRCGLAFRPPVVAADGATPERLCAVVRAQVQQAIAIAASGARGPLPAGSGLQRLEDAVAQAP